MCVSAVHGADQQLDYHKLNGLRPRLSLVIQWVYLQVCGATIAQHSSDKPHFLLHIAIK